MLKNFFKVAFRNLARYKSFSFINIAGLTFGLTACLLIGLFVWDEHQFDTSTPGGDRVYRIYNGNTGKEGTRNMAVVPPMFATTLKKDFPGVEQTARILMPQKTKILFEAGDKKFYEANGLFVDSTFLEVLPMTFVHGSPVKALDDPASIVLSREMARRLFGKTDPVGKEIQMDKTIVQVKGVFQKDPRSHLQYEFLCPLSSLRIPVARMQKWGWQQFYTYVKVKKGTAIGQLESNFRKVAQEQAALVNEDKNNAIFQPLANIHLYSADFKYDNAIRGNITYVNALSIIAVFILLIACFNFINLATAKSLQRAREVGVRKSIGAGRRQLIFQFTGETVLLTFISLFVSVGCTLLLLPWLNSFTGKNISFAWIVNPVTLLLLLALTFVTGLLAGFYPALVLSGFKPVKVLKGTIGGDQQPGKIPWLRHGLVVVQFSLSVLLIISAIVVYRQVSYLHNKDLGFSKEQIMFFPMRGDNMSKNRESFKNELLRSPGISSVSIGYGFPGDAVAGDGILVPGKFDGQEQSATQLIVDFDYVKTLNLQVIAGRDFSTDMQTDKDHAFIINATAVRELGFGTPENALGKPLAWHPWGASNMDSLKMGHIIGVVKDFNYKSLYDKVETTVLQIFPTAATKVAVKIKPADIEKSIAHVRDAWNKFTPEYPIEYKFLDENFERMYNTEDKLTTLLWIFTVIAVFVGCLGLLGLAAYSAERRRKEVSIRKVLGASVQRVVLMLSKDFIQLVLIALLIASPIAWYFMNQWLTDFAYRVTISWWIFALTAVAVTGIAFFTVSFQAFRAAVNNPVAALRSE